MIQTIEKDPPKVKTSFREIKEESTEKETGRMNPGENDLGLEELLNFWASSAPEEKVAETGMLTAGSFLAPPQSTSATMSSMASTMVLSAAEYPMLPSAMSEGPFDHSIAHQAQHVPDFSLTWAEPLTISASSTSFATSAFASPPSLICPPNPPSPTFTSPISYSPLSEGRITPYSRATQSPAQRRLSLQESEEEKTRKRRARNREAAARCREKRRAHEAELGRRESRLEEEGRRLGEEVARLGEEKRHLVSLLALHRQLFLQNRQGRTV